MSHPANIQLRAFRDAVYHRYTIDPALQRPASELVELRAIRFEELGASGQEGRDDVELIRHWAVADLLAAQDARDTGGERIREAIFANALKNSAYAATIALHSPELLRRTGAGPSPSIVDLSNTSTIDSRLAALGYRMEPSLSSLDSEDDGDALIDMATEELVDPPTDELRDLAVAWTAEQEALAPAREAIAVIAKNHDRLLRAIDGVVPKEQLRAMVAEDVRAMRTIASPEQRNIAATSMAESAAAHPGYVESLIKIDEMAEREVAAAGDARKQAEADFLLVQVERRRELLDGGDAAALTASAHADALAVMRIATDEERLLALVVIGSRAEKLAVYRAALTDVSREVAEAAAAARARVHDTFIDRPRDPSEDASLANKARKLSEPIATSSEGEGTPPALASLDQAEPVPVQGELDMTDSPSSSDTPAEPSGVDAAETAANQFLKPIATNGEGDDVPPAPASSDQAEAVSRQDKIGIAESPASSETHSEPSGAEAAEAAAMESIRARHALRREAGAPIDAVGSAEVALLAQADAEDLKVIASADGLHNAAASLEDCLADVGYMSALEAADLRTGAAMKSLYFDLLFQRMEEERKAEAARRRGIFGVLVEEGHAVHDFHDGSSERLSYFMKYVEDTGYTGTAWGDHLPAALRAAGAEIGDRIRFRWKSADEQVPDKPRFLLEVVDRAQFADNDAVVKSSPSLPEEPRPQTVDQAVSPATSKAQAGTSHANKEANSELPRHQVGPDANSFVNHNAQAQRVLSDALGLTPKIEELFARGMTATEVTHELSLAGLLDRVPYEDRSTLILSTRATLGIPSQFSEEGKQEFTAWKEARSHRLAQDEAPSPNSIGHGGRPTPTADATHPVIDGRALDRLVAKRQKESAAARAAAGLQPPDGDPATVSASANEATPSPARPLDPEQAPSTKPKAAVQQPPSKPRPANPLANGVTGDSSDTRPVPSEAIAKLLESVTYEVKGNGSVLYLVRGKAAFLDHGQQILMHDAGNEEDDAILAAILLAKEKWGKVELTGTQAFKQRALELLAKHNLDVQLKNPEQDATRRQLATAAPAAAAADSGPKPLMGQPQPGSDSTRLPTSGAHTAAVPASPQQSRQSVQAPSTARPQAAAAATATTAPADVPPPPAPTTLAKDLAPIRARDWWATQRAAIAYWSKGKPTGEEADLAKLGPEPSAEEVFWFDKGGRRCDPPADAKAFAESFAASDAKLKEMNMADRKGKGDESPVLLRGVIRDGDEYKTTVLLFKGKGDYLQGFIEAGGLKHQVIVHINQRKPDADGVLRPNFLKVAERVGSGTDAQWKEIGYGNVVNHRSDGKAVHFDEVLFNLGNEVVAARLTAKVDSEMHKTLGFLEARKPRSASPKIVASEETADPKQAPAAHALEGAAGVGPATQSRRSSRTRAAA